MNTDFLLWIAHWVAVCWLVLLVVGTPLLYVGYGFAMSAKGARDRGASQAVVVKVDGAIVLPFMVLDAVLNVLVFSVITLDFRRAYTLTYLTERLSRYSRDAGERKFRRFIADVFAAFVDGKDPSGDHILGANTRFSWLD